MAISDLLTIQLENYQKREKNGNMSISSLNGCEKIITGHLLPMFGSYKIKDTGIHTN